MSTSASEYAGHASRTCTVMFGVTALVLGIFGMTTCEFLKVQGATTEAGNPIPPPPDTELPPPFTYATEYFVGVLSYEIIDATFPRLETDGCVDYEYTRKEMRDVNRSLASAQYCGYIAPIFGILALVLTILDWWVCATCSCGDWLAGLCYIIAMSLQAGTFAMLGETSFCFEDYQECSHGIGVVYSALSVVFYFIASVLQCCGPLPPPAPYPLWGDASDASGRGRRRAGRSWRNRKRKQEQENRGYEVQQQQEQQRRSSERRSSSNNNKKVKRPSHPVEAYEDNNDPPPPRRKSNMSSSSGTKTKKKKKKRASVNV